MPVIGWCVFQYVNNTLELQNPVVFFIEFPWNFDGIFVNLLGMVIWHIWYQWISGWSRKKLVDDPTTRGDTRRALRTWRSEHHPQISTAKTSDLGWTIQTLEVLPNINGMWEYTSTYGHDWTYRILIHYDMIGYEYDYNILTYTNIYQHIL